MVLQSLLYGHAYLINYSAQSALGMLGAVIAPAGPAFASGPYAGTPQGATASVSPAAER
jgi:hypothetical protein